MKAIKIDSVKQEIIEIEIDDTLDSIYEELDCTIFTCPVTLDNMDSLYVDDEGLLVDEYKGAFYFGDYSQPLFGNGLLIGANIEGESESVASSIKIIEKKVKFLPEETGKYILSQFQNSGYTFISL
jgi:hypothetical protein